MGKHTSISWALSTLNLVMGCTKVSTECTNCYIYRLMPKFGKDPTEVRILDIANAIKRVKTYNEIIFVNSFGDWLHEKIPDQIIDNWMYRIFKAYDKQFLLLTKRAERLPVYFKERVCPDRVWLGVSCGIKNAKHRIDILRKVKCKIHFISFEPLIEDLGELDLSDIEWAIIGGESKSQEEVNKDGQQPRPMQAEWAEAIIKQCREQNVNVWFKQFGGIGGDGAGGELLNGRKIQEYPDYKQTDTNALC